MPASRQQRQQAAARNEKHNEQLDYEEWLLIALKGRNLYAYRYTLEPNRHPIGTPVRATTEDTRHRIARNDLRSPEHRPVMAG